MIRLTQRLRCSLRWFLCVLRERWVRRIPYSLTPEIPMALVYPDAESHGDVAAVFVFEQKVSYIAGRLPGRVRKFLQTRRTNIAAYELLAAILAIFAIDSLLPAHVGVRHFVDSTPALACAVKGSARPRDLNLLTGFLWFSHAAGMRLYWGQYVRSASNLADGPSRSDFALMKRLEAGRLQFDCSALCPAAEEWLSRLRAEALVL